MKWLRIRIHLYEAVISVIISVKWVFIPCTYKRSLYSSSYTGLNLLFIFCFLSVVSKRDLVLSLLTSGESHCRTWVRFEINVFVGNDTERATEADVTDVVRPIHAPRSSEESWSPVSQWRSSHIKLFFKEINLNFISFFNIKLIWSNQSCVFWTDVASRFAEFNVAFKEDFHDIGEFEGLEEREGN